MSAGNKIERLNIVPSKLSQKIYRHLAEDFGQVVLSLNKKGIITYANDSAIKALEGMESRLVDKPCLELVHPDDRLETLSSFQSWITSSLSTREFSNRILAKDGNYLEYIWKVFLDYDRRDHLKGIILSGRDISDTGNKQAPHNSGQGLNRLLLDSSLPCLRLDTKGIVTEANRALVDVLGLSAGQIEEKPLRDLLPSDQRKSFAAALDSLAAGRGIDKAEFSILDAAGAPRPALLSAEPDLDDRGKLIGSILTLEIQPEATNAPQIQQRMISELMSGFGELEMAYIAPDLRITGMSRYTLKKLGFTEEQVIGRLCYKAIQKSDRPCPGCTVIKALENGSYQEGEVIAPKGGTFLTRSNPILDRRGRVQGVLQLVFNITELKEAEKRLSRFRKVLNHSAEAIYLLSQEDFTVLDLNDTALKQTGRSRGELLGLSLAGVFPELNTGELRRKLSSASSAKQAQVSYETTTYGPDGYGASVEVTFSSAAPCGDDVVVAVSRDITSRKQMDLEQEYFKEQMVEIRKMEAIGTLAGGVAHEFNNILGAIIGYTEIGVDEASEGRSPIDELHQVLRAAERARRLVDQILAASSKADTQARPLDLNQQVVKAVRMLRVGLPKMISIETNLDTGLHLINGDAGQIKQMILNLGTNAGESMPQGGRIALRTRNRILDAEFTRPFSGLRPGSYVELSISDTGKGIPPFVRNRIFEPFFTTKDVGQGMGLGLSIAFGIARAHGGYLTCDGNPDMGAVFRLYLPVLNNQPHQRKAAKQPADDKPLAAAGVLLVDDERAIRDIGRRMLSNNGYNVLTASSGEEALELFRQKPDAVNLVLLDISMPGMGGAKCLEELKAQSPELKVLVASGYTKESLISSLLAKGAMGFLRKPFQKNTLLNAVAQALSHSEA